MAVCTKGNWLLSDKFQTFAFARIIAEHFGEAYGIYSIRVKSDG